MTQTGQSSGLCSPAKSCYGRRTQDCSCAMPKSVDHDRAFWPSGRLTRREVAALAGGTAAWLTASGLRSNAAEAAPRTVVLVNESYLRRKYPNDIVSLLVGLEQFAARQNADLLFVGANAEPKEIKAQLLKQVPRP